MDVRSVESMINRVRREYVRMPRMRLTLEQIRQLCGIDAAACVAAVNALLDLKCLCASDDGTYARQKPPGPERVPRHPLTGV